MTFSKELYWKNRKAGKRGQGEVKKTLPERKPVQVLSNGQIVTPETYQRGLWVNGRWEQDPKTATI